MKEPDSKTVDHYISTFPQDIQENLQKIRKTIKQAVPDAQEVISYQMPAYKYHGYLVYFAAFKNHYSLFIPPNGVYEAFKKELEPYTVRKATLQLPISDPLPFDLIEKLVIFAAKQNESLSDGKAYKRPLGKCKHCIRKD